MRQHTETGAPAEIAREDDGGRGRRDGERERVNETSRPAPAEPWHEDEVEEISLLELVNVLLRRWKLLVALPITAAVLAVAIALILPAQYTASSTFVPETGQTGGVNLPSGLSGLASQFGVSIPGSGGATSPQFYSDVVRSRTLQDAVLGSRFPDPRSEAVGDSATLLDILEIDGDTEAERLEAGRKRLNDMTSVDVDGETNIVTVGVESHYPVLAAGIANLYVRLLNRFNLETRQSQAEQRRKFIEERLGQAESELRAAEDDMKAFLERNRSYDSSPQLSFEHDRLDRQVQIKQDVYTELRRQYEEARIQEVNDTPVITVIDAAVPPQEKSSPKRKLIVIMAFFLGGVLGVFGAFGQEFMERARREDADEYREMTSHWSRIRSEIRGLFRRR